MNNIFNDEFCSKLLILNNIKKHLKIRFDKDFADFLGIKTTTLAMWYKRNSYDVELLFNKCEFLNPEWLLTGKGEMLKESAKSNLSPITTPKKDKIGIEQQGIPLIPLDAMAGFGTGGVQVMDYDTQKYVVPEFTELNVDFMIRVKGSSMYPKYNSGDLVACKKLVLSDIFFQWNKVYVLDTDQGALIKRIKKGSEDNLLIVSDNPSYDPYELHLSQIHAIAIVLGVIRLE